LFTYNAEVYQYVGDEIVVSWPVKEGLKNFRCIDFYFGCEKQLEMRKDYYIKNYGQVPHFKAGMHLGKVTAVEIGEIKRDIAYHGDTLNTAARIQSMCNQYEKKFLVSGVLLENVGTLEKYNTFSIGNIVLKGKTEAVEIASIETKVV
jgi:adenylate cyclase